MPTSGKNEDFQKFFAIDEKKQKRILNAAMKEFSAGYKNASTDNIVREAGISKGLLFHYFGSKERLYDFLINFALETVQREYVDLINVAEPDILESVWQLSLIKRELSLRHPALFDLMASAYVDTSAPKCGGGLARYWEMQAGVMAQVYGSVDHTLFREDIDTKRAVDIITWALEGYAHSKLAEIKGEVPGSAPRENYEKYLEEFQDILDILRRCFYKQSRT